MKQSKSGFSLVELLVVIVIMALLASIVVPNIGEKLDTANRKTTKINLDQISNLLDSIKLDINRYPTTEEGLKILYVKKSSIKGWNGPYSKKEIKGDAWSNPFIYKFPGKDGNDYELLSYGADGKEGGSGKNADISVWE